MSDAIRLGSLRTSLLGPDDGGEHRLLILLHGRGANGSDLAGLHAHLTFGGRLLCPDGPLPWAAGGTGYCWYDDPSRRDDIESSSKLLWRFIDESLERFPTRGRPILGGFSQGGVMTYELGLRNPERFDGLIAMSAFLSPDHPCLDRPPDPATVPPLLVTHGTSDPLVTVDRAHEAGAWLGAAGIYHEYVEDATEHGISPNHLDALNRFLAALA